MSDNSTFTEIEQEQYSRHLRLSGFGFEKQSRLRNARILLVGAGGLGCPIGLYLAAAGVGTIGVVDFDRVERSNLQRQIAHSVESIGQLKVDSLIAAMQGINPLLTYEKHPERLSEETVFRLIQNYDLVLDGSDNFGTRFLLADACYLAKIPLLQGAVYEYEAQLSLFLPDDGPCYRCVFEEPPSRNALAPCADVGVLGVVPGTAGLMMATEAIKYLTGFNQSLREKLLIYNVLNQTLRQIKIIRNQDCPLCGQKPSILEPRELTFACPSVQDQEVVSINAEQAQRFMAEDIQLLDVRELTEFRSGHLPEAIHLSLRQMNEQTLARVLSREKPVLAYCQKGQRSQEAVRILRENGYEPVYSLTGGLTDWPGKVMISQ